MMSALIFLLDFLERSFLLGWFGVRKARRLAFQNFNLNSLPKPDSETVWFHASSLGELEMLTPLIEDFAKAGVKVAVSAFSDSALKGLKGLNGIALYAALSPPEREWLPLFRAFKVKKLIIAKYDFWPGMMKAASDLDLPVVIVNAEARRSFWYSRFLFLISFTRFPRLYLFSANLAMSKNLISHLPASFANKVKAAVDPRIERVARRIYSGSVNPSLEKWRDQIAVLPKPIGVIGSAWMSDLEKILPAMKEEAGSMVVVPHDLSADNLKSMAETLSRTLKKGNYLLVNEMGLLVELYRDTDWVFVGGGFGQGVHSLLEPALRSVPIASGPNRLHSFPEAAELLAEGRLTECQNTSEIENWIRQSAKKKLPAFPLEEKRKQYETLVEGCLRAK